jgi:hypothetical protein
MHLFVLYLHWLLSYSNICELSLNKSCKTYHTTLLPPSGRNWKLIVQNEGKSAAIFCRKMAALVPDMFCNCYLVKNHKVAYNSATTKAREKISTYLKSLEF